MNDVPCCWAHCIKIMASGGVASPTDKLTSTQFSLGEMRSIVEEAVAVGTYVCVKTNQGRISEFRMNHISGGSPKKLKIGYTTWQ